jgi:methylmalonyl-CoA mutase, C-terminal domain
MSNRRRIRVLIGKIGLDGHNRGAKVVAMGLRDAGMEVIYSGLHQTVEMVTNIAIQEDVDVVGISTMTGAYMDYLPRLVKLLREKGADDKLVIAGGIIRETDISKLKQVGVAEVFLAETYISEIVNFIRHKTE